MAPTNQPSIPCQICHKKFFNTGNLNSHMRIHTGERPYKCNLCQNSFTQRTHLKSHHEGIHSNELRYQCELCEKRFKTKNTCRVHMLRHKIQGRPFKCDNCLATFKEKGKLAEHLRLQHDPSYSRGFKCIFCNKIFSTKSTLDAHLLFHTQERPYFCKVCPAEMQTQRNLTRHMESHDPNRAKKFECDLCHVKYFERSDLKSHRLTHVTERPFICDNCGKAFRSRGAIYWHRNKVHFNKDKTFACKNVK